jgi:hypothetical protein
MKLHFKKLNRVVKRKTIMLVFHFCKIWLQNTPSPGKMELCTETEYTGKYFSHLNLQKSIIMAKNLTLGNLRFKELTI